MRSIQGAVLFVDMLGFGALTRGKVKLREFECLPWKVDPEGTFPHQLLAARILVAFRKTLLQTKKAYSTVKVAQLSDCAFLWSSDVGAVVDAGRYLMHDAACSGLLCRGGLAFGDVHEPNKVNQSLGAFIVGDAVTRAVTYEGTGKGMRIFTDVDTASEVLRVRSSERFRPLVNPLTGDSSDEWQWYVATEFPSKREIAKVRTALERLVGCHCMLRFSPKFAWSATTDEGRRQLACSVAAVAEAMDVIGGESGAFKCSVEHLLGAMQIRSDETRQRIQKEFVDELVKAVRAPR